MVIMTVSVVFVAALFLAAAAPILALAGRGNRPGERSRAVQADAARRRRPRPLDRRHPSLRQRVAGHGWPPLDAPGHGAGGRRRLRLGLDALRHLVLAPSGCAAALPRARARFHAAQPTGHRLGHRRVVQGRAPPHPATPCASFRARVGHPGRAVHGSLPHRGRTLGGRRGSGTEEPLSHRRHRCHRAGGAGVDLRPGPARGRAGATRIDRVVGA